MTGKLQPGQANKKMCTYRITVPYCIYHVRNVALAEYMVLFSTKSKQFVWNYGWWELRGRTCHQPLKPLRPSSRNNRHRGQFPDPVAGQRNNYRCRPGIEAIIQVVIAV
jgi:hypothetical protein